MTNEQIDFEVIRIKEHQAKTDEKFNNVLSLIDELREDVKSTKSLAEDVHIMAINMENMQKTLEETNNKVDALSSKEFKEYKENKKLVKDKIISAIAGAIGTGIIGLLVWFTTNFIK